MKITPETYLVLDVGTTGIKAILFDGNLNILVRQYKELNKYLPKPTWVEQSPDELVSVSRDVLNAVLGDPITKASNVVGMGITNQRETTIVWDKVTGKPVYPAIVWEDSRTKDYCDKVAQSYGPFIREKTGLEIDSYFSASKINWILNNVDKAQALANDNLLCFGTVDTWLLWNLAEGLSGQGHPHKTDYSNASRTLLFDINKLSWNKGLLDIFNVPPGILPSVEKTESNFGFLSKEIFGQEIPIVAVAGDQQSSLFAAGSDIGTTKITYGTGIFILQIIGQKPEMHKEFFTTMTADGQYALEAKINDCGNRVKPIIGKEPDMENLITHFAEKVDTILKKLPIPIVEVVVDGGVTQYEKLQSIQEKISGIKVIKQKIFDGTALGTAALVKNFLKNR